MRVLIQYNCIPHYRARIFELLSGYTEIDFSIVADSRPDTPHLKTLSGEDGRDIRFTKAETLILRLPFSPALSWQPGAVRKVWSEHPDVVIALGSPYSVTAWVLAIIGWFRNMPVLLWGHGLLGEEYGPKWWLRKTLYRLAAGQLLYGEYARDLLVKKGFDEHSLYVVYNSLDFDEQQRIAGEITPEETAAFRDSLNVTSEEGLVVFTGRLQKVKRLDLLIEAIGILSRENRRVHVALIGEGDEEVALKQLAVDLGVEEQIDFLGPSYDERFIGKVIAASDVSVIPSGAGLSVMHALVFGTPVILHDRVEHHFPEWEAVIEGETGYFYRYGDVNDLALKIYQAVSSGQQKERMSIACRSIIEQKYNPHMQLKTFVRAARESLARAEKT